MGDSEKSSKDEIKPIEEVIEKQKKEYNFREDEIKTYHNKVIEVSNSKELKERKKEYLSKKYPEEKITQEKLDNRTKNYGEKQLTLNLERWKNGETHYVLRNKQGEIVKSIKENTKKTKEEHQKIINKELKKEKFNYEKYYVPEDTEPLKQGSSDKDITISYNTYFRYGILIYRLRKGKKYEILYQASDTQARSIYLSFQRIIAEIKQDILNNTNISLEEWIYLSKVSPNIHLEGGLNYKRFKGIHTPDKAFSYKKEYEQILDFERL